MRFLRILALLAGGFAIGSCADDGGGAKVKSDVSWFVYCAMGSTGCGSSRTHHKTDIAPKVPFRVSCNRIGDIIEFTITDPGADDDPATPAPEQHPFSQIEVSNGNPAARTCDVTIRDSTDRNASSPLQYSGKCAGSAADGTCVLNGAFNQAGWLWAGTLLCTNLSQTNSASAARYDLASAEGQTMAVKIAVDNCD
jgi:hypothetical protein